MRTQNFLCSFLEVLGGILHVLLEGRQGAFSRVLVHGLALDKELQGGVALDLRGNRGEWGGGGGDDRVG